MGIGRREGIRGQVIRIGRHRLVKAMVWKSLPGRYTSRKQAIASSTMDVAPRLLVSSCASVGIDLMARPQNISTGGTCREEGKVHAPGRALEG